MRLIDGDKIKQSVTNEMLKAELNSPMYCTLECVIADIDNQPTVYDVDKVVEQLKEEKENAWDLCDGGARYSAYDNSIDIVKSGGIE